MSTSFDNSKPPADWLNTWREIEGAPRPDDEQAIDSAIHKVMVAQKRETNRKNLPDLAP